jgi:hypothetical protein
MRRSQCPADHQPSKSSTCLHPAPSISLDVYDETAMEHFPAGLVELRLALRDLRFCGRVRSGSNWGSDCRRYRSPGRGEGRGFFASYVAGLALSTVAMKQALQKHLASLVAGSKRGDRQVGKVVHRACRETSMSEIVLKSIVPILFVRETYLRAPLSSKRSWGLRSTFFTAHRRSTVQSRAVKSACTFASFTSQTSPNSQRGRSP